MSGFTRILYSPRVIDGLFLIAAAVAGWGLIGSSAIPSPAIAAAANPLLKGGALIALACLAAVLALGALRFDRKTADDYVFQTFTTSAYIGMFTFMFAAVMWHLLVTRHLGSISLPATIFLWMLSWALGYFLTRLFGTRAA